MKGVKEPQEYEKTLNNGALYPHVKFLEIRWFLGCIIPVLTLASQDSIRLKHLSLPSLAHHLCIYI